MYLGRDSKRIGRTLSEETKATVRTVCAVLSTIAVFVILYKGC